MPVVIPEFVAVVGLFFAIVGYIVARGLLATWVMSLGFVFQWLGSHLRFKIRLRGLPDPRIDFGGPFRAIDHAIITALQTWANGAEIEMGYFLHGAGRIATLTAQALDYLARETSQTFEWLVHVHLPKRLRHALEAAFPAALLARLIAHAVARAIPAVRREVHTVTHEITHTVTRTVFRAQAATLPRPMTWPSFRRAWNEIKEWQHVTAKRLVRLELLLAASGLALAVANMTGTRVGCWRGKGNIARMLRHVCGVPTWLVDLLVVGAVEAFIVTDLCRFTDLLMREAESFRPALLELVDVEDALIGCHGTTKPLAFALPALSLPPMPEPSALAA